MATRLVEGLGCPDLFICSPPLGNFFADIIFGLVFLSDFPREAVFPSFSLIFRGM